MFVRAAAAQENVNFQYTTARIPIFSYVLHNSAHEWVINEYCAVVQEPLQNVVDDCCLLLINISRAEGRKKERSRGNFGNKNVFNVGGFGKLSWIKKFNLWQIDFKDQTDKLTNSIRISHYDFFPPLKFDFLLSWVAKKKREKRQFHSQEIHFHLSISTRAISMLSLIEIWVGTHRWKLERGNKWWVEENCNQSWAFLAPSSGLTISSNFQSIWKTISWALNWWCWSIID